MPTLRRLVEDDGVPPSQVAVLTNKRTLAGDMFTNHRARGDATAGGPEIETVGRFKGLEASVVILALSFRSVSVQDLRWALYVGMSRARSVLFVLSPFDRLEEFEAMFERFERQSLKPTKGVVSDERRPFGGAAKPPE